MACGASNLAKWHGVTGLTRRVGFGPLGDNVGFILVLPAIWALASRRWIAFLVVVYAGFSLAPGALWSRLWSDFLAAVVEKLLPVGVAR